MGVYHLAGLGLSIGAVTAAFSYLAARKALPDADSDPLFALSGEAGEDPRTRGAVEALVLFATQEIVNDNTSCKPYTLNEAGQKKGREYSGGSFKRNLLPRLLEEVRPLARRDSGGGLKPLELYWCIYDENAPVRTFERAVEVMRAASGGVGRVGKEFWVNLTGGRNIINGALQLAASMTGSPARMYYLLSADEACVRHTVPAADLRTERDHFWVDLPVVYLDFSDSHRKIIETIEILGGDGRPVPLEELLSQMSGDLADRDILVHSYLRPLAGQRLIVHEVDNYGRHVYRLGEGWVRERRYLEALRRDDADSFPRSLSELAHVRSWFRHDTLPFD